MLTWLSLKDQFGGLKIERGRVFKSNREPGEKKVFEIRLKEPNEREERWSVKILFSSFLPFDSLKHFIPVQPNRSELKPTVKI